MSSRLTDNDDLGFDYKVRLRLDSIAGRSSVNVLECYAGHGWVWNAVRSKFAGSIAVTQIDKRKDKTNVFLRGDNRKYLATMDLSGYDIIDLDAYGIPFEQLEIVFGRGFRGIVHGTFIQSGLGTVNKKLLVQAGYTDRMVSKCPTLFGRNGFEKFCKVLSRKGLRDIMYLDIGRKFYFYFDLRKIQK